MSQTYDEIMDQPAALVETLGTTRRQWEDITARMPRQWGEQALFVGCGTSLYIAECAARSWQESTASVSSAVPGSEIFLSPRSWAPGPEACLAFVFSRSGTTTEAVRAAAFLREQYPMVRVIAITCNAGTPLADAAHHAVELPHASDESVVMTRSFTNMLVALQLIAMTSARETERVAELERLPELMAKQLGEAEAWGRALGEDLALDHFVFLGLGPLLGAAREGTLKLKEMTQVACEAYSPLEFRHGPISTVREGTAAVLLEGERERRYAGDVEADLADLGARVATIGPYARADHALRLPDGLSDVARAALYLPPLQFLAYHRALALGLDPDRPRNLSRVVTLGPRAEG